LGFSWIASLPLAMTRLLTIGHRQKGSIRVLTTDPMNDTEIASRSLAMTVA